MTAISRELNETSWSRLSHKSHISNEEGRLRPLPSLAQLWLIRVELTAEGLTMGPASVRAV